MNKNTTSNKPTYTAIITAYGGLMAFDTREGFSDVHSAVKWAMHRGEDYTITIRECYNGLPRERELTEMLYTPNGITLYELDGYGWRNRVYLKNIGKTAVWHNGVPECDKI